MTASITEDKRSTSFLSDFSDLFDGVDDDDDDEEARLISAVDLRRREDEDIVLGRRAAMAKPKLNSFSKDLEGAGLGFINGSLEVTLFPRVFTRGELMCICCHVVYEGNDFRLLGCP